MRFLNVIPCLSLMFVLMGCSQNFDNSLAPQPKPVPPVEVIEEKNVVLESEEIKIMSKKDHDKLSTYKLNTLNIHRKTPPETLFKNFTFPDDFQGSVKLEWSGTSAVKPGPSDSERLECNMNPYVNLLFVVVRKGGTEQEYFHSDVAEIRSGDILRVSPRNNESDCTMIYTSFTATLEN